METFSALLALCAGNSPFPGEFPAQRPVTRSFDVFFDLRPNIRLSKQSWGWWFETPSHSLWCHCNVPELCTNLQNMHIWSWDAVWSFLTFYIHRIPGAGYMYNRKLSSWPIRHSPCVQVIHQSIHVVCNCCLNITHHSFGINRIWCFRHIRHGVLL